MSKSGPHFPQIATGGSWGARVPKNVEIAKNLRFRQYKHNPPFSCVSCGCGKTVGNAGGRRSVLTDFAIDFLLLAVYFSFLAHRVY